MRPLLTRPVLASPRRCSASLALLALALMSLSACAMGAKMAPQSVATNTPVEASMYADDDFRADKNEALVTESASFRAPARKPAGALGGMAFNGDNLQGKMTPPAGGTKKKAPQAAPPPVDSQTGRRAQRKTALVVEGWLTLEVGEVPEAAKAISAYVAEAGGRIMNEQLSGSERSWSGSLQVKLPPEAVDDFVAWLAKQGDITSKRITGTDVSRTLFDQQIALDNLQMTLSRMRKLLDRENMDMKDILAIEREMTRLRGEIERIKGQKRFLEYRVAMATLDIQLRRRAGVILGRAEAKFYPGARLSTLVLLNPDGRQQVSMGGGLVVHTLPRLTLELDVFDGPGTDSQAFLATFGGAAYSDFLGRGKRRFLNPYLGLRAGYGYLDGSAFAFGGGGGVELFKHEYALIDASVNVYGLARKDFDVAVSGSLSAVIAF